MARALPTGIVRTTHGYRVFVWVPDPDKPKGRIKSKRYPAATALLTMKQWRDDQRTLARKPHPISETPPLVGFAADAATYLAAVRAMPSYADRVRDIGEWIALLGETPSLEILSQAIRAARDRWLTIGPKRVLERRKHDKPQWIVKARPLAASTVNHRLRALENFFTVMYPKQPNPVREVPEATEPDPQPRGHSFALALEILSFMPDVTTPKKGELPETGSLSRVRFAAMLWTGLPAIQVARLTPEMVNWTAGTFTPARRQKGRQSRRARGRVGPQARPLLPQAIAALKQLFALNGNRAFSSSSLERSVRRAVVAANKVRAAKHLPPLPAHLRVYDLTRHSYATEAMRASGNLKAVQELMGHRDITQTERYAAAAVSEQTVLAIAQMTARMPRGKAGHLTTGKVSPGQTSRRVQSRRKPIRENA